MSLAKRSSEMSTGGHVTQGLVRLGVAAALPAAALLAWRAGKPSKKKGFAAMQEHGGEQYKNLPPKDKKLAEKYYEGVLRHSPSVAKDPIASWNLVHKLVQSPGAYSHETIKTLRDVESAGPKFFRK